MADGYQPSSLPGAPPPPAYAPSSIPAASGNYGPQIPAGVTITPAQISKGIISNESGGRNVTSPQGAVGPGQIMPGTFNQYARPGENIHNPADNLAVHNRIIADYASRWPNDPARVAVAYFSGPGNVSPPGSPTPWIRNSSDVNENVAKYVANATAKMGGPAGTSTAAAAPAAPAQPANIGSALAALNTPTGGTKSTMQNLEGMASQDSSQPPQPQNNLQGQMAAAAGDPRQAQLAAQGAQLMAALRLRGGITPTAGPASTMSYQGGQMIPMPIAAPTPGTTLNSTGGTGYG